MPAFWSSKPKAPTIQTQNLPPTSNPHDDPSTRAFSATTQRSSEEGDGTRSGQTTPKPSGLDARIPAISSVFHRLITNSNHQMLQSPTPTPRHTQSLGTELPPPTPATPTPGAPIGPPKGRLTVRILQAKNLRLTRPDVPPSIQCSVSNPSRPLHIVFVSLRIRNLFPEVQ